MNIYAVLVLAIISAIIGTFIKKKNAEFALVFSLCATVYIMFLLLTPLFDLLENINALGIDEEFIGVPIKVAGINILGSIAKSVCDDAGEKSLSNGTSIAVKVFSMVVALPLFETLLEQVRAVLSL